MGKTQHTPPPLPHFSPSALRQAHVYILTQPTCNLIKTPNNNNHPHPHPSLHLPPLLGNRSLVEDFEDCMLVGTGWGGGGGGVPPLLAWQVVDVATVH